MSAPNKQVPQKESSERLPSSMKPSTPTPTSFIWNPNFFSTSRRACFRRCLCRRDNWLFSRYTNHNYISFQSQEKISSSSLKSIFSFLNNILWIHFQIQTIFWTRRTWPRRVLLGDERANPKRMCRDDLRLVWHWPQWNTGYFRVFKNVRKYDLYLFNTFFSFYKQVFTEVHSSWKWKQHLTLLK